MWRSVFFPFSVLGFGVHRQWEKCCLLLGFGCEKGGGNRGKYRSEKETEDVKRHMKLFEYNK